MDWFNTLGTFELVSIGIFLLLTLPVVGRGQENYDVIIRNGRVFDGTGNPWFLADVALQDGKIVAIGPLGDATAGTEIDATGLFVAPGFIDTHTHAGGGLATAELSHARPLLAQGQTMILANPDGRSPMDLAAQREALLRDGLGVNVGQMMGHGSLRQTVIGMEDRLATAGVVEAAAQGLAIDGYLALTPHLSQAADPSLRTSTRLWRKLYSQRRPRDFGRSAPVAMSADSIEVPLKLSLEAKGTLSLCY